MITLLALPLLGFHTFLGGNLWPISKDDPKLYLRFCDNSMMVPDQNDVGSNDPLYQKTLTHDLVVDSIINDYNSIPGSYVRLADSARDPSFDATLHAQRIIDICFSSQQAYIEGHSQPNYDSSGEHYNGCTIQIGKKTTDKASRLLRVVTHEIGHCLALDHPQETIYSIMSYFASTKIYRLQDDDKAGILSMYPVNPGDAKAVASFGLACSPR